MSNIRLPARIEHLERCVAFVAGHAEMAGFTINRIHEIELATEEALVNIIHYAYPETDGDVGIDCLVDGGHQLIIKISDSGVPFNILDVPDPDISADISDREIGGLGVFFVKEMANEARYLREGSNNILTLIFHKVRQGIEEREHCE